jgi:Pyridoxal-phosphate dependent enzyme
MMGDMIFSRLVLGGSRAVGGVGSTSAAIRVVGVEPEAGNDTYLSVQEGRRITIDLPDTIADGLRTTSPGERTFEIVTRLVDEVVLVSEAEIAAAITTLALTMKTIARAERRRWCRRGAGRPGIWPTGRCDPFRGQHRSRPTRPDHHRWCRDRSRHQTEMRNWRRTA